MSTNEDFKLLSFPEVVKKKARKQKWETVVNWLKNIFKRKRGFEKYRISRWGYYEDSGRTWVEVQNLKTGKIKSHILGFGCNYKTVKIFVGRMK